MTRTLLALEVRESFLSNQPTEPARQAVELLSYCAFAIFYERR